MTHNFNTKHWSVPIPKGADVTYDRNGLVVRRDFPVSLHVQIKFLRRKEGQSTRNDLRAYAPKDMIENRLESLEIGSWKGFQRNDGKLFLRNSRYFIIVDPILDDDCEFFSIIENMAPLMQ